MGYSARYHAASLAAVFLALAVGILIGVGFGSDVVTGTAEDLERSLGEDLDEANAEIAELEGDLTEEREFAEQVFPALVGDELAGRDVALVGLGALGEDVSGDVQDALAPSGARLGEVAVVVEPPDVGAISDALIGDRGRALPRGEALAVAARRAGRLLVGGGGRFGAVREALLSRYSGSPVGVDAVVLVRDRPDELEPRDDADTGTLEQSLIEGMSRAGAQIVGVERTDVEDSSIGFFQEQDVSSVDNVDQVAGRAALVWTLDGAEGSFGVKETADALLPERVQPPAGDSGFGPR
jgi:Copper transport outer membrane protein, MctB